MRSSFQYIDRGCRTGSRRFPRFTCLLNLLVLLRVLRWRRKRYVNKRKCKIIFPCRCKELQSCDFRLKSVFVISDLFEVKMREPLRDQPAFRAALTPPRAFTWTWEPSHSCRPICSNVE